MNTDQSEAMQTQHGSLRKKHILFHIFGMLFLTVKVQSIQQRAVVFFFQ